MISREPIIRAGIRCLLAGRTEDVVLVVDSDDRAADVVIYDVIGLHLDAGHDLQRSVDRHPGRVLALARALQPGLTARALAMGAVASVPLGVDADELLSVVRAVAEGHLQDGSAADLANRRDRSTCLGRGAHLTRREQQVLTLVVAGDSNDQIAHELYVTANTVKSYIRSAYAKIGVHTRAQAVAWGIEHGFWTRGTQA